MHFLQNTLLQAITVVEIIILIIIILLTSVLIPTAIRTTVVQEVIQNSSCCRYVSAIVEAAEVIMVTEVKLVLLIEGNK